MDQLEIRKKMILEVLSHPEYKPMKLKELFALLGLKKKEMDSLRAVLAELVLEGEIILTGRGKYMLPTEENVLSGTFIGHPSGYGFVEIEDWPEDVFIPATETASAMHGDIVQIRLSKESTNGLRRGKKPEGKIIQILKRAHLQLIGIFQDSQNYGFVIPDISKIGKDIYIGKNLKKKAKTGDKVVVKLLDYGSAGSGPRGEIIEVLGDSKSIAVDITSAIRSYELKSDFSEEAEKEAEQFGETLKPEDYQRRLDLREELIITIDGEDAKDLDDAVSIDYRNARFYLGVHIADVSHYVKEGSFLDKEALQRGTSHYLVDRVLPMLPPKLSNGLCSLNPGEDRLSLSCLMVIDCHGKVISHEIRETVINSKCRLSYQEVAKLLEPDNEAIEEDLFKKYQWLLPKLRIMADCADILQKARHARGSIDFDFTEAKFLIENDRVSQILAYERNVATKLIEDFMLIANQTVAEHFYWQSIPFVYRSHGEPKTDKISELSAYLKAMDFPFRQSENIHPKELQILLAEVEGRPEENIIRRMVLRSMQQARYSEINEGHFGLSTKYYCHFTSPIRRYPDLQIHRIIKEVLGGRWDAGRHDHYSLRLGQIAAKTSALERRADEIEREVHKLLKAHYMQNHIGECFEGIISGVNAWGFFVELPNTAEGLVPTDSLCDDYYEYEENQMALIGMRYQKSLRLGDKVRVTVFAVDLSKKTIDFRLKDEKGREGEAGFLVRDSFRASAKKSERKMVSKKTKDFKGYRKRKRSKK